MIFTAPRLHLALLTGSPLWFSFIRVSQACRRQEKKSHLQGNKTVRVLLWLSCVACSIGNDLWSALESYKEDEDKLKIVITICLMKFIGNVVKKKQTNKQKEKIIPKKKSANWTRVPMRGASHDYKWSYMGQNRSCRCLFLYFGSEPDSPIYMNRILHGSILHKRVRHVYHVRKSNSKSKLFKGSLLIFLWGFCFCFNYLVYLRHFCPRNQ